MIVSISMYFQYISILYNKGRLGGNTLLPSTLINSYNRVVSILLCYGAGANMLLELHEVVGLEFNGTGFTKPGCCVSCTKYDENTNIVVLSIHHTEDKAEDELNEYHFGWQEPTVAIKKRSELGLD